MFIYKYELLKKFYSNSETTGNFSKTILKSNPNIYPIIYPNFVSVSGPLLGSKTLFSSSRFRLLCPFLQTTLLQNTL